MSDRVFNAVREWRWCLVTILFVSATVLAWSGEASALPFSFRINFFQVNQGGVDLLNDGFGDGLEPPSGPEGASTYFAIGTFGSSDESGSSLTLNDAGAVRTTAATPPVPIDIKGAVRLVPIFQSGGAFFVEADFAGILPRDTRISFGFSERYRVNLRDLGSNDDVPGIRVVNSGGAPRIDFFDLDIPAGTFTILGSISPGALSPELTLRLNVDAAGNVTASFDPDGPFGGAGFTTIPGTATIYNGESVTFAEFLALSPVFPLPTSTPSVTDFPAPEGFLSQVKSFIQTFAQDFSEASRDFLQTTVQRIDSFLTREDNKVIAGKIATRVRVVTKTAGVGMALVNSQTNEELIATTGAALFGSEIDDETGRLIVQGLAFLNACKNLLAGGGLSCAVGANIFAYDLLADQLEILSTDPPDLDFTQVVSLVSIPPIPTFPQLSFELNEVFAVSMSSHLQSVLLLNAANRSFDRYAAALTADDATSATLQLEAFLFFLAEYKDEAANAFESKKVLIQRLLEEGLIVDGSYDPNVMIQLQNDLAAGGFPSSVTDFFASIGLTSDQIARVLESILAFDPNQNVGIVVGLFSSLHPGLVFTTFPAINVTDARIRFGRGRLRIQGRFRLLEGSQISLIDDDVTVTLLQGSKVVFSETIFAGSFFGDGDDDEGDDEEGEFEFKGASRGIKKMKIEIDEDGEIKFRVNAKGLDLNGIDLSEPVTFALQIGDDFGQTDIQFNTKGRFRQKD